MTDLSPRWFSLGVGAAASDPSPRKSVLSSVRTLDACQLACGVSGEKRNGQLGSLSDRKGSHSDCWGYSGSVMLLRCQLRGKRIIPATVMEEALEAILPCRCQPPSQWATSLSGAAKVGKKRCFSPPCRLTIGYWRKWSKSGRGGGLLE